MSNDIFNPVGSQAAPHSTHPRSPWGPWRALLGTTVAFLGSQIILGLLVSSYASTRHWSSQQVNDIVNNSVSFQFWYVFIAEILTLATLWLFVMHFPWSRIRDALGLRRPRRQDLLFTLIGVATYIGVYTIVLTISNMFMHVNTAQQQDVGFQHTSGVVNLVLAFISLAVLPPIAEEIMFRGFLFAGLRRVMPFMVATAVVSLAFALPHSAESTDGSVLWVAAIDTFSLSLVLCYLREKTGALYAGMGVHAIKNTLAFALLFIFHMH